MPDKGMQSIPADGIERKPNAIRNPKESDAQRLQRLLAFQRKLAGEELVAGMDEAGRGPLAGAVYAACAIMDEDKPIAGVNDSKKVSEGKRENIARLIKQQAIAYGIGWATVAEIEQFNILNATKLAMQRAWEHMDAGNAFALIDGVNPMAIGLRGLPVIKGDEACYSIAAASILAKTERDRVMRALDYDYPQYGFARHKGYGTKLHIEAIKKYGPCPEHRMSFLGKILKNG